MNNLAHASMIVCCCLFTSNVVMCSDQEKESPRIAKDRWTFMLAVQQDHTEAMESLLDHKADPNWVDEDGCTPLRLAAFRQHTQAVELLLGHGACVNQALFNKPGPKHQLDGEPRLDEYITVIQEVEDTPACYLAPDQKKNLIAHLLRHANTVTCTQQHLHKTPRAVAQELADAGLEARAQTLSIVIAHAEQQEKLRIICTPPQPGLGEKTKPCLIRRQKSFRRVRRLKSI